MTYSSEVLADSPILYWRLGDASGTSATDSSGAAKHGTYVGSPTLGVSGLLIGDANTAVTFNGTTQYINYADPTNLSSAFTIEAWIKTSITSGTIAARWPATSSWRNFYLTVNSGKITAEVRNSGGTSAFFSSTSTVNNNAAHHIVLTFGGGVCRIYVDGAQENSASLAGSLSGVGGLSDLTVAALRAGVIDFAGTIDEFAYYSTELSAGRVAAHYTAGITPGANEINFDAVMPAVVGGLSLDTGDISHVSFSATMPSVVGNLALDNAAVAAVRFNATLPSVVGSVQLGRPIESEVNRAGSWVRDNIGTATWSPAVVPPTVIGPQNAVVAQAFAAPSIEGTHAIVEPTLAYEPEYRDRIIVNGRDISFYRGVPTPPMDFQYVQPLGWSYGTLRLPQAVVPFEVPGEGDLFWLTKGAPVVVQRVDVYTDEVIRTDYRGFVLAHSLNGGELAIETAGHGVGRMALQDRQMMLIQQRFDAGAHVRRALSAARLISSPRFGAVTGINLIRWGGGNLLDYFNELIAKMTTLASDQWTVMPTDDAVYVTALKDTETIHGTVYLDDARIKGDLRSDMSEEPNRIFASGVTPEGMVIKNGAYPGLVQAPAAPYPMFDNSNFGIGTSDGDTDTGDGITVMIWRLRNTSFVDLYHPLNSYDTEVAEGIKALQRRARLPVTGTMTPNTWRALFDLSVTGYNLSDIRVLPMAEDPRVQPWRLSANGSIIAENPDYVPSVIPVDRTIPMGSGFTRAQIQRWSQRELITTTHWRGTIEINTGAIVAGEHEPGDAIGSILRARDIRPGMNLWLPLFAGGIVVHVAGVSVTDEGRKVTLVVDTRAGDTLPVWAAIQRDRDNRDTVHRSFFAQRKSANLERENTFDEVGGTIPPITLRADNWTVFPVVAKQAGTIERIRVNLSPNREFVLAVFGRRISAARLRAVTNAPLTIAGRKRWTEENVYDKLDRDHVVLYVAGSDEDPCGYFPGRKSEDDPLTGRWDDEASFPFVTFMNDTDRGSVLWVAVWVGASSTIDGGRIMWPSAEEY